MQFSQIRADDRDCIIQPLLGYPTPSRSTVRAFHCMVISSRWRFDSYLGLIWVPLLFSVYILCKQSGISKTLRSTKETSTTTSFVQNKSPACKWRENEFFFFIPRTNPSTVFVLCKAPKTEYFHMLTRQEPFRKSYEGSSHISDIL